MEGRNISQLFASPNSPYYRIQIASRRNEPTPSSKWKGNGMGPQEETKGFKRRRMRKLEGIVRTGDIPHGENTYILLKPLSVFA